MPKLLEDLSLQGHVEIQVIDYVTGKVTWYRNFNALTVAFRGFVAAAIAGLSSPPESDYISLATGEATGYAASNRNTAFSLGLGSYAEFAQGFKVGTNYDISHVLTYLKRVGTSAGTILLEIQPDSAGFPSGTPVTDGISDAVTINGISVSDFEWIVFNFTTEPALSSGVQYHAVLKTTGYTYGAATEEVQVGADSSSPSYADGAGARSDGTWVVTNPVSDLIFRVVPQTTGSFTNVLGEVQRNQMTSKAIQGSTGARLLANFALTEANEQLGHVGMFDLASGGNLHAIATIQIEKTSNQSINVYWLIDVT